MSTDNVLWKMREVNEKASKAFQQMDYKGAIDGYNKALQLCRSLPVDVEFDRNKFEAMVYADLSTAFGRLGKHMDSFAAANNALTFFDQRIDKLDDEETGKYLMAQVNQGVSLAALGCFEVALEALFKAKEVFSSKGLDPVKNRSWLDTVESNIVAIKGQIVKRQG